MKSLIFDAGPIISLSTNNLLWILKPLKEKFGGEFVLPLGVKHEVVDRPLQTRKFKFEALQVQKLIDTGILTVPTDKQITTKGRELLTLANSIIEGHGQYIKILQVGEIEAIAASLLNGGGAIAIDERITRTLIENPKSLHRLMQKRLHTRLKLNEANLEKFVQITKDLKVIRSVELVTVAFEIGILDKYLVNLPHAKRELLESVLWGLKLNGASVSGQEINELIRMQNFS